MSGKNRTLSKYSNRWNLISDNVNAEGSGDYAVDTTSGPVSITLSEDLGVGAWVRVIDAELNAGTNNIIINAGSLNIVGRRSSGGPQFTIDTDGQNCMFVYTGDDWIVIPGIDITEPEITTIADNSAISFAIALG